MEATSQEFVPNHVKYDRRMQMFKQTSEQYRDIDPGRAIYRWYIRPIDPLHERVIWIGARWDDKWISPMHGCDAPETDIAVDIGREQVWQYQERQAAEQC